jgi:hypothetical protein
MNNFLNPSNVEDVFRSLVAQIKSLQSENKEIKDRLTYLESTLHTENERLRDENFGWRQAVDYYSEDYCSNEDSSERKY